MKTLTDLKLSESCVGLRHTKKLLKKYRVFNNCNGSWLALEKIHLIISILMGYTLTPLPPHSLPSFAGHLPMLRS